MQHTTMLKKQKNFEGKQEITRRKYAFLQEKVKEAEEEKMRKQKKTRFFKQMTLCTGEYGQQLTKADNELKPMKKIDKVKCLKAQLRFRKYTSTKKQAKSKNFNFLTSESGGKRGNLTSKELKETMEKK